MIAEQVFVAIMATAKRLGSLSKEERMELFKQVAECAFEMQEAFDEVYQERDNSDDYL